MYDPYQHAHELGITIIHTNPGPGLNGLYTGKHNGAPTIHLRPGLTTREERSLLAHELVHAEHDDQPTTDHAWSARRERRCDRIAAQRLTNRDHLIQLAATYPAKESGPSNSASPATSSTSTSPPGPSPSATPNTQHKHTPGHPEQ